MPVILEAKLKAVRRKVRSVGAWRALRLALSQLIDRLFRRTEVLFYTHLRDYEEDPRQLGSHVSVREIASEESLTEDDASSLRAYAGDGYLEECRRRLKDRWVLFMGYIDGRPAGGAWVLTHATPLKTKIVPILATDAAIIDCFTFPESRGRNVYPVLLSAIACHYKGQGGVRAFGYVSPRNLPSVRGLEKAGFRPAVAYEAWKLGSWEIVAWRPVADD